MQSQGYILNITVWILIQRGEDASVVVWVYNVTRVEASKGLLINEVLAYRFEFISQPSLFQFMTD